MVEGLMLMDIRYERNVEQALRCPVQRMDAMMLQ